MESEGLDVPEWLWGTPVGKGGDEIQSYQSHLIIQDLMPLANGSGKASVVKRDGIRISHISNTVEKGKKYDYNIVEPGACFRLTAELTIRSAFGSGKDEEVAKIAIRLMNSIHHVRFRLGAFTSQGFGMVNVSDPDVRLFQFPTDSDAWFHYLETGAVMEGVRVIEPSDGWKPSGSYPFSVVARFRIKSAMMVGSGGDFHSKADKSSIKSNHHFVLPGKSIRGALRHRAQRILRFMQQGNQGDGMQDLTRDLFGYVDEGMDREGNSAKGRLLVEESVIGKDAVKPMLQNRIRIDRFTGGVIDSGLFNSEPIWTKDGESIEIAIHIVKDVDIMDKRLLLMLLKDLWTGDLPIGGEKNVGRGVLLGLEAQVFESDKLLAHFKRREDAKDSSDIEVLIGAQALEKIMETE
jgi:CRISPR/Cas system CSM-associated protein Csm3 (group 7 of RAMP superfamily)